jgi:predicted nucleic-acid-binding Zn-ribbon protein
MSNSFDRDKFIEHLKNKWKDGFYCPVCRENNWAVHESLSGLREFDKGSLSIGGPIVPIASITCNNCGYTMHFNAIKAGLIKLDNTKEPKDKEK